MKNPNGYGSVYKLKGNRRRPWAAGLTTGYNKDGYPKYKFLGFYEKQEHALNALSDYNKNPYDLDLMDMTIAETFDIFKERRFEKISKSGQGIYNAAYIHLKPVCGTKINSLKTYQIQKIIDQVDRKWQTKSHVVTLLSQLFDIAIELDVCNKNYAKFVDIGSKPASDIHQPFTKEEIQILYDSIFVQEWADTVLIMIYTGLRPSELLKIEKSNVNLEERIMIGGLKTKAGKDRTIPIHSKILPLVKKRMDISKKYLVENNGKHLTYAQYKIRWIDLMNELKLDHLPHDCRHTFASLMDTAGANKLVTKRIMGHASSDITDKIYTHKQAEELLQNINLIDN